MSHKRRIDRLETHHKQSITDGPLFTLAAWRAANSGSKPAPPEVLETIQRRRAEVAQTLRIFDDDQ